MLTRGMAEAGRGAVPARRGRTWSLYAVWATVIGGTAAFLNIIEDVVTGDSTAVDRLLLRRGHLLATSPDGAWMTPAAKALSLCGNWQVLVPLGVLLLLFAWRGRLPWRVPGFYALACAGAGALILFWKHALDRPRPEIVPPLEKAPFASFPSGHSAYAVACYGFLLFLMWRHLRGGSLWGKVAVTVGTLALVALIGLSRVYLGTHYPSDVAGGLLLGVPWLAAVCVLYERAAHKGRYGD